MSETFAAAAAAFFTNASAALKFCIQGGFTRRFFYSQRVLVYGTFTIPVL
jgi:hypothetical protein